MPRGNPHMYAPSAETQLDTHEVTNQPPPFAGIDAFADDVPLREALDREGGAWVAERAGTLGKLAQDRIAFGELPRLKRSCPIEAEHEGGRDRRRKGHRQHDTRHGPEDPTGSPDHPGAEPRYRDHAQHQHGGLGKVAKLVEAPATMLHRTAILDSSPDSPAPSARW